MTYVSMTPEEREKAGLVKITGGPWDERAYLHRRAVAIVVIAGVLFGIFMGVMALFAYLTVKFL